MGPFTFCLINILLDTICHHKSFCIRMIYVSLDGFNKMPPFSSQSFPYKHNIYCIVYLLCSSGLCCSTTCVQLLSTDV